MVFVDDFRFKDGEFKTRRVGKLGDINMSTYLVNKPIAVVFEAERDRRIFMFSCETRLELLRVIYNYHDGFVKEACLFNNALWSIDTRGQIKALRIKN
jgi:hypothetical protein